MYKNLVTFFVTVLFFLPTVDAALPDFSDLVKDVSPSVVKINTLSIPEQYSSQQIPDIFRDLFEYRGQPRSPAQKVRSSGSGFVISSDGYIVTNHHVVDQATEIQVLFSDRSEYQAIVIGSDRRSDLALLKINAITPFVYLSHSKGVPAGMDVVTIGYPQVSLLGLNPKITRGIVNSDSGIKDDKNSFQFSAEVQKGNSGGPLIAPGGTVVGVVQSKLDALKLSEETNDLTQNVNFATKSSVLLEFLRGVSNIPSTQPLEAEQPMRAIRIYDQLQASIIPIVASD